MNEENWMSRDREVVMSRRALLQVAAAGGAAWLIFQPGTALAATGANIEKASGAVDAYVGAIAHGSFTNLSGIHAEYRDAIAKFPFALPKGWAFPPESSLSNTVNVSKERASVVSTDAEVLWERGNGYAEAYLYWQSAVAGAACHAFEAGDAAAVERLLDTLETGYNSSVRLKVLEDPTDEFLRIEIPAARSGNFDMLKSVAVG
ncbi:MAG: hypothetical protein J0J05_11260 [Microbacterium sp.]|uniref:hypothetical protein n=1 Tax=Bacteria TaxID=2 RepID=UPI000926EC18|nr:MULTISPECIES: hypothetical protein [Bacteria]MBN9154551.1 hypothetical protein [Microbacterium sp.]OJU21316.1 MAG: hypothetical protein BGN95_24660 [Sphingomonas sp. 66-10]